MGVRGVGRDGRVRAQCVGRGGRCRLHAAPHLRGFPVRLHAGYSAVRVVGWCGKFDGVGTVDMGVRGWGVVTPWWVGACTVCWARCEVQAARSAPLVWFSSVFAYGLLSNVRGGMVRCVGLR
jgi:hypothetical protein